MKKIKDDIIDFFRMTYLEDWLFALFGAIVGGLVGSLFTLFMLVVMKRS